MIFPNEVKYLNSSYGEYFWSYKKFSIITKVFILRVWLLGCSYYILVPEYS